MTNEQLYDADFSIETGSDDLRDVVIDYLCRAATWEIFPGVLALLEAHPESCDD